MYITTTELYYTEIFAKGKFSKYLNIIMQHNLMLYMLLAIARVFLLNAKEEKCIDRIILHSTISKQYS